MTLEGLWNAASVRMIDLIQESNSGPNTLKSDRSAGKLLSMQLSNLLVFCSPGHISFKSYHTILQLSQPIGWHGTGFRWIHNLFKIHEWNSRVYLATFSYSSRNFGFHILPLFLCNYIVSIFCNYSASILFIQNVSICAIIVLQFCAIIVQVCSIIVLQFGVIIVLQFCAIIYSASILYNYSASILFNYSASILVQL